MRRASLAAAVSAALAAAAVLAYVGVQLLSLPAGGDGVARSLAGGGDERHLGSALALFEATVRGGTATDDAFGRRARAEAALAEQGGSSRLQSQARTLLGVLTYEDAAVDRKRAATLLPEAEAAFRDALRLDPDNEDAAADLELLLQHRSSKPSRAGSGSGGRSGHRRHGHAHGATAATGQGEGY